MANPKLVAYVRTSLAHGYSEDQITKTLLRQGWKPVDIDSAIGAAMGQDSPEQGKASVPAQKKQPETKSQPAERKKMVLRRIGVFSLAKLTAVLMAIVGLAIGLFYFMVFSSLMGMVTGLAPAGANFTTSATSGLGFMDSFAAFGMLSLAIVPAVFAVIGFVTGALGALIYNIVARFAGGYEMEFE